MKDASKALRAQAAAALRELLAGVDLTDRAANEAILAGRQRDLYPALVSVVVRLVFLLFAEEKGLLHRAHPSGAHPPSLSRLHADLRHDFARHGAALDDRHGAWAPLIDLLRAAWAPASSSALPRVSDGAVLRALDRLVLIDGARLSYRALDVEHLGSAYEGLLGFEIHAAPGAGFTLQPGGERRRSGAHYTSQALTRVVVERALGPLLHDTITPEQILSLKVCDPAMGSGAFLVEACRHLTAHLVRAWQRSGTTPAAPPSGDPALLARRLVTKHCLYGVDKNPLAVDLARATLWLETMAPEPLVTFLDHALRAGDSLLGLTRREIAALPDAERKLSRLRLEHTPFQWDIELPEVFNDRGGFDAILGNPPWVSYAGRAAQPLSDELRSFYIATSPAFAGYRNLQGIFVHRAATMLRPGGRLGLVLPTSMSDLAGYEPSRRAHDLLCQPDDELPDFGDAFDDVFQPSMALLSTRRPAPLSIDEAGPWPLERKDLDPAAAALLDKLSALSKLPPHLFGERGFQTNADDVRQLQELTAPRGRFTTGVRVGGDIEPFLRRPPRLYCDPADFGGRFRRSEEWQSVKLLIRQTARFPMAVLSDGAAFRNSILAGFEDDTHSIYLLLAYLNSTPLRWYHYFKHRDARQGMPQLKIGHLRAFPDLPASAPERAELEKIGRELSARNTGIAPAEQARIDALVAAALALDDAARKTISAWADSMGG